MVHVFDEEVIQDLRLLQNSFEDYGRTADKWRQLKLKMVNFLIILWLFWSTKIREQVVTVWCNSCTEFSYSYWNIITPSESSSQLLIEDNGWGNISHSSESFFPAPNLTFRNVAINKFVSCDKEMKEDNAFIEKALYTYTCIYGKKSCTRRIWLSTLYPIFLIKN